MMNHRLKRLSTSAFVLALALAVSMPSPAGAKPEGHGKHGRGHSVKSRGGDSGMRGNGRGGGKQAFVERGHRGRAADRAPAYRSSPRSGSPEVRRYREPRADYRPEIRYRDSGTRYRAPSYRTQTRYKYADRSYSTYRHRTYYTSAYHRPRYHYHSGFSIGVFIGVVPSYGYRYFDPYCDIGFRSLAYYDDHCYDHGHPTVIQVLHISSGYPVASCAYRGGDWVVDDCY